MYLYICLESEKGNKDIKPDEDILTNGTVFFNFKIKNTEVFVVKGDITEERTDIIVNPANENLLHGGGVAWHISKKGGSVIDEESREYVEKYGKVKTGSVAYTNKGNLKCKKCVIHAVGPIYEDGNNDEDKNLGSCIEESLKLAVKKNAESISFPAISSGIFGFPKEKCAEIFFNQIIKYIEESQVSDNEEKSSATTYISIKADDKSIEELLSNSNTEPKVKTTTTNIKPFDGKSNEVNGKSLKLIRLINIDYKTANIFYEVFKKNYSSLKK